MTCEKRESETKKTFLGSRGLSWRGLDIHGAPCHRVPLFVMQSRARSQTLDQ